MGLIPMDVEPTNSSERSYDIYSRLLNDRIIFLGWPVDDQIANTLIAQMLFLAHEDSEQDIRLHINSPRGDIYSGLAIYDTMQMIRPDVSTFNMGVAAGIAAVLLAGGKPGKRYALPNSKVVLDSGSIGIRDSMKLTNEEWEGLRKIVEKPLEVLSIHTGKSLQQIKDDVAQELQMSADEALAYGIVDEVLQPAKHRDE
ncbi:MAG: ATP-dependent Clp protease proteolytic subunit [Thermomicrobiales bacterium]